jgi:hypothetical protein
MAAMAGMGRKTLSNILVTAGLQFQDWTGAYRLFSKERVDPNALFAHIVAQVHLELPPGMPFVAAIDDTKLPKSGKKVYGASYQRDPLGPKFHTNLVWAQRFLQISAILPQGEGARTIPVDFQHAPLPKKPKKNASEQEWLAYRQERESANLSKVALQRIALLRKTLNQILQAAGRILWIQGDNGYTNATILKNLPENTIYTGRVRKDARLYFLPESSADKGRKRLYGAQAPTPEAVRQDPDIPWQEIQVYAAGKCHTVRVKTLDAVRSPISGQKILRLIVIQPLGYRLRKNSKILYRQPAYLICTDPTRALQEVVQFYFWRWEIEVNHRDEKNILGIGQAQVRQKNATGHLPAFLVASYAMLLLAAHRFVKQHPPEQGIPRPRWQKKANPQRPPLQHIIQTLRTELWADSLDLGNLTGFVTQNRGGTNAIKYKPDLPSALFFCSN